MPWEIGAVFVDTVCWSVWHLKAGSHNATYVLALIVVFPCIFY